MKTFLCWCPDSGEDAGTGSEVEAHDFEEAAEAYAENHDNAVQEFPDSRRVSVRDRAGMVVTFVVEMEMMRRYTAGEEI